MKLNCGGKVLDLNEPRVMGIINLTPDSFYAGNRAEGAAVLALAEKHLREGAVFLDVGAQSTRPGAEEHDAETEWKRLAPGLAELRKTFPEAVISVDTYRADVARWAVEAGADMINDIGGGTMDAAMFETISRLRVPYVLMHIQGVPKTMQVAPMYENVVDEVFQHLHERVRHLRALGVADIIIDPGFGFGKTTEHNYALLSALRTFSALACPLLVGVSRKKMINEVLGTSPENALNGTTAVHVLALQQGANILRAHDVRAAVEAVQIVEKYRQPDRGV